MPIRCASVTALRQDDCVLDHYFGVGPFREGPPGMVDNPLPSARRDRRQNPGTAASRKCPAANRTAPGSARSFLPGIAGQETRRRKETPLTLASVENPTSTESVQPFQPPAKPSTVHLNDSVANSAVRDINQPLRLAFSVGETAAILGVSEKTVRRLISRKLLRSSRALRHLLIPKKEIERFLADTLSQ